MNLIVLTSDPENSYPPNRNATDVDLSFMEPEYNVITYYLTLMNYEQIINNIDKDKSVVVNLCDGYEELNDVGISVVKLLEEKKIIFTGCSSNNFFWGKSKIKKYNVSTPKSITVNLKNVKNIWMLQKGLHYPLIIKPSNFMSGGSEGITLESVVQNALELSDRIDKYVVKYKEIVIEEFIHGREFTVLAMQNIDINQEPIVLEPIECVFENGETFKHFAMKWKNEKQVYHCEKVNHELGNKIMKFCQNLFKTFELDGYVRFDLRMNKDGCLYVIDVNPYCSIFASPKNYYSADLILSQSKIMNHKEFVLHQITSFGSSARN